MDIQNLPPVPKRSATRIATTLVFFVNGFALSLFFSNIPVFQRILNLGEGDLGTALSLQGFGTVIFALIGSGIAIKFSNRNTMLFGAIIFALAAQFLAGVNSLKTFTIAIFVLGACNSFVDVAMNAHATIVEREYAKEIMSTFHAAYNFGGFAGALLVAKLIDMQMPLRVSMTIAGIGIISVIILGWNKIGKLHAILEAGPQNDAVSQKSKINIFRNPAVLILGCVVALALFTENAMNGWSSVYLNELSKSLSSADGESFSAYAFAIFQLAMCFGRLFGSWIISRIGASKTMLLCGCISALGAMLIILFNTQGVTLLGFGLIGLGLANCIPMFFSRAAAAMPATPALGIALVNTLGYVGYISGPFLMGKVAEASSLKNAFALILIAMIIIALSCRIMSKLKPSAAL